MTDTFIDNTETFVDNPGALDPYGDAGNTGTAYEDAEQLRRLTGRIRYLRVKQRRGNLAPAFVTLRAPIRALREAYRGIRNYGGVTASHSNVSHVRQFAWAWWLNVRYHFDHETVWRFRMFDRKTALKPLHIPWRDAQQIYRQTIPRIDPAAVKILFDKRNFARWCAEHDIPTPEILVEFKDGRISWPADKEPIDPQCPLFAKWVSAYGGAGARAWAIADGAYREEGTNDVMSFHDILQSLSLQSAKKPVILQRRLENHREIHDLSLTALSTIRMMTTRRPNQSPRLLIGIFRMGRGSSMVDNFSNGGFASPVDARRGILDAARYLDDNLCTHVFTTHPDTGRPIRGRQLPFWKEAVNLSLKAHSLLGELPCVGWDVAITDRGPVIIEGNVTSGTKVLQAATQQPLLHTEFAAVHTAWLNSPRCQLDDQWLLDHEDWTAAK